MKINKNIIIVLIVLISLISISNANASVGATLETGFANGTASFEALIILLKFVSRIMGILLVIEAIFKFSQLGTNPQVSPKTPIVMFFAGIGIFALVSSVSIASQTLAMGSGPGDILVQGTAGGTAQAKAAMVGVLTFIRLVGYIAFIRGWLLINAYGQGKEGTLGRGLTHIFGGVAAINVQITAGILANTFAPGVPMPF